MIYARIHYKATCIIHHTAELVVSGLFQACPKKNSTVALFLAIDPGLTISTREKRKVMVSISGRSLVTNWSVHIYFTLAIIRPFFSFEKKNNPRNFLVQKNFTVYLTEIPYSDGFTRHHFFSSVLQIFREIKKFCRTTQNNYGIIVRSKAMVTTVCILKCTVVIEFL